MFGFDIVGMAAMYVGISFSIEMSLTPTSLETESYKCYFNQGPFGPPFSDDALCSGPTASTQGGITASMPGGSFIGSLISGPISDRWGRRVAIRLGGILWCIGSIVISASQVNRNSSIKGAVY